jgi:hypothetical protein
MGRVVWTIPSDPVLTKSWRLLSLWNHRQQKQNNY